MRDLLERLELTEGALTGKKLAKKLIALVDRQGLGEWDYDGGQGDSWMDDDVPGKGNVIAVNWKFGVNGEERDANKAVKRIQNVLVKALKTLGFQKKVSPSWPEAKVSNKPGWVAGALGRDDGAAIEWSILTGTTMDNAYYVDVKARILEPKS